MIYAMYNKLVEFDENMDLIPALAESWSVAGDNVTWTFNLREGVSFHSGTPFNATHVVEHFETILANPGGPYSLYSAITNISAPDDNTVVMVTATPNAAILTNLAYGPGGIPNADLINSLGDDYSASADGTGAFELSSYTPGERIEFTANEDYWGGEPAIENLNFVIITDAASRNVAVQTGEVQLAESISLTDVPTVEANANLEQIILTERLAWFWVNHHRTELNDTRVRQAINYAINKTAIVEDIFGGLADEHTTVMPVKTRFAYETGKYAYNITKAAELMDDAGYSDGFTVEMWTLYGSYLFAEEIAEYVQAQLDLINITVTIVPKDSGSIWGEALAVDENGTSTATFDLMYLTFGTSTGDPDYFMVRNYQTQPPTGFSYGYNNSALNALLADGKAATDPIARGWAYANASQIVFDDAVGVWLFDQPNFIAHDKDLEGVIVIPNNQLAPPTHTC
jgi:peptide/nickel transport system substrate-binding protein